YLWSDGTTGFSKTVAASGLYWVKSIDTAECSGIYIDSFEVAVERMTMEDLDIGNDTILCSTSIVLDAGMEELKDYLWNTGATSSSIEVSEPGQYYVTASSSCYFATDTIAVSRFYRPLLKHLNDTMICQ